uniref:Uncharacterized protein n=1 Tax=Anguilla anguilla TaxID=7936 RepID=A0A0E9T0B4_ANGAN
MSTAGDKNELLGLGRMWGLSELVNVAVLP